MQQQLASSAGIPIEICQLAEAQNMGEFSALHLCEYRPHLVLIAITYALFFRSLLHWRFSWLRLFYPLLATIVYVRFLVLLGTVT